MSISQSEIDLAKQILGINDQDLLSAFRASTLAEAKLLIGVLVQKVKANYRKQARQLHPDLNPDDEVKARQFSCLAHVYSEYQEFTTNLNIAKMWYQEWRKQTNPFKATPTFSK